MRVWEVTNIVWDTDGEAVNLPTEAHVLAEDASEVADILSDEIGWCVLSLDVEPIP